jgi:hypothetical protein
VTGAEFSEVDIDLLADYVGGALDGTPDEAVVAARIADDPAWHAAYDELSVSMASVGAGLGALGAVAEPMPAELVARLDAAFASAPTETGIADPAPVDAELAAPAAPQLVASGAGAASGRHLVAVPDGVDRADGTRGRATRGDRRRRLRWVTPIAVAAGLLGLVGFGIDYLAGRSGSSSDTAASSSAAGAGEAQSAPLGAAGSAGRGIASLPSGGQILASGTDYQSATLGDDVVRTLTAPRVPETDQKSEPDRKSESAPAAPKMAPYWSDSGLARLQPGDALQDCLDAIAVANGHGVISVQTIDYARYQGSPALVVRFSAANGKWAWASGPDCGSPAVGAATLNHVQVG